MEAYLKRKARNEHADGLGAPIKLRQDHKVAITKEAGWKKKSLMFERHGEPSGEVDAMVWRVMVA